jgi:hypothetical protein
MFGHGLRELADLRSGIRCPMREDSPDSTVGPFSEPAGIRHQKTRLVVAERIERVSGTGVPFGRCAMWTRI